MAKGRQHVTRNQFRIALRPAIVLIVETSFVKRPWYSQSAIHAVISVGEEVLPLQLAFVKAADIARRRRVLTEPCQGCRHTISAVFAKIKRPGGAGCQPAWRRRNVGDSCMEVLAWHLGWEPQDSSVLVLISLAILSALLAALVKLGVLRGRFASSASRCAAVCGRASCCGNACFRGRTGRDFSSSSWSCLA